MAFVDLIIDRAGAAEKCYSVKLIWREPADGSETRLTPPEPPTIELDPRRPSGIEVDSGEYAAGLTAGLFAAAEIRAAFQEARGIAASRGAPLQMRLRIDPSAGELQDLHWETLLDPEDNAKRLLDGENLLFSRFISSGDLAPERPRSLKDVRALVVVANPDLSEFPTLAQIDVERELETARAGLGRIPIDTIAAPERVTLKAIESKLLRGYDIVYLVCHGTFRRDVPYLWLEDDRGGIDRRPVKAFVETFEDRDERPQLVVLASCQSAGKGRTVRPGDEGALVACGPLLACAGVPAVVAMQGSVSMETVAEFMPVFFEELRREGRIDRAVAVARGAIRDRPDYWMPVLFLRSDGRLWLKGSDHPFGEVVDVDLDDAAASIHLPEVLGLTEMWSGWMSPDLLWRAVSGEPLADEGELDGYLRGDNLPRAKQELAEHLESGKKTIEELEAEENRLEAETRDLRFEEAEGAKEKRAKEKRQRHLEKELERTRHKIERQRRMFEEKKDKLTARIETARALDVQQAFEGLERQVSEDLRSEGRPLRGFVGALAADAVAGFLRVELADFGARRRIDELTDAMTSRLEAELPGGYAAIERDALLAAWLLRSRQLGETDPAPDDPVALEGAAHLEVGALRAGPPQPPKYEKIVDPAELERCGHQMREVSARLAEQERYLGDRVGRHEAATTDGTLDALVAWRRIGHARASSSIGGSTRRFLDWLCERLEQLLDLRVAELIAGGCRRELALEPDQAVQFLAHGGGWPQRLKEIRAARESFERGLERLPTVPERIARKERIVFLSLAAAFTVIAAIGFVPPVHPVLSWIVNILVTLPVAALLVIGWLRVGKLRPAFRSGLAVYEKLRPWVVGSLLWSAVALGAQVVRIWVAAFPELLVALAASSISLALLVWLARRVAVSRPEAARSK